MLLVSEDFSSMTVWTILYYTRYAGKLSTRSLSYLCPDLPSVVRKHYNRRSLWLSSSCERASFKRNKLMYVSMQTRLHTHTHTRTRTHARTHTHTHAHAHTHTLTFVGAYIIVGAIRPASMWHNTNSTWMFNATLFQPTVAFVSCDNHFAVFHSSCI